MAEFFVFCRVFEVVFEVGAVLLSMFFVGFVLYHYIREGVSR